MQLRYQITRVAYRGGAFQTANNNYYFTSKYVHTQYTNTILLGRYTVHLMINKVFSGFRHAPAPRINEYRKIRPNGRLSDRYCIDILHSKRTDEKTKNAVRILYF